MALIDRGMREIPRYRLKQGGIYLHMECGILTPNVKDAWEGTHRQLVNARTKFPLAAACRPVRIKEQVTITPPPRFEE